MKKFRTIREWEGGIPQDVQQRMLYAIAEEYVPKMSLAALTLMTNISQGADLVAAENAVRLYDHLAFVRAVPALAEMRLDPAKHRRLERVYERVINQAAGVEMKLQGWVFKNFALENPYSIEWIRERSGALITSYILEEQVSVIKGMLERAFRVDTSLGPRQLSTEILRTIDLGLNTQQEQWAQNRYLSLLNDGVSEREALRLTQKYEEKLRKQRALTIARTETIEAEARGVRDAWQVAQDRGIVHEDAQKEWVTVGSASSNQPCQICGPMDGVRVGLNEDFTIQTPRGTIQKSGPTAHPNCRCTQILIVSEAPVDGPFNPEDFEF